MCGECDQIPLAQCSCDFAAAERKRMTEQFVKAGLGDGSKQEAAYDALLAEYVNATARAQRWPIPGFMPGSTRC